MPRESNDDGIKPFEIRPGVGGMPEWGGMYRRGDPSHCPPNRFHSLLNVRTQDSEIVSRPGLVKTGGSEMDACITGMLELDEAPGCATTHGIFLQGVCVLGASADSEPPFYMSHLGPDGVLTPCWPRQPMGTPSSERFPIPLNANPGGLTTPSIYSTPTKTAIEFNGRRLVVGTEMWREEHLGFPAGLYSQPTTTYPETLYLYEFAFRRQALPPGDTGIAPTEVDLHRLVALDRATYGNVVDMVVRHERITGPSSRALTGDVLYLGMEKGQILRWDGVSLSLEHTMTSAKPVHLCVFAGQALCAAGWDGVAIQSAPGGAWSAPEIAYRDQDDNPQTGLIPQVLIEWRGRVVILGGSASLLYPNYWDPDDGLVHLWKQTVDGVEDPPGKVPPETRVWFRDNVYAAAVLGGDLYVLCVSGAFDPATDGARIVRVTSWEQNTHDADWVGWDGVHPPQPAVEGRQDPWVYASGSGAEYLNFLIPYAGQLLCWRRNNSVVPVTVELVQVAPVTGIVSVLWRSPDDAIGASWLWDPMGYLISMYPPGPGLVWAG